MSLLNQLIAAVFAVLIGLVSGTLYIMSDNAKDMLLNQLESHGQDTATHLGLYLAPYIADSDTATIETTVNAIFDSGFYQKIDITDAGGQSLFVTTTSPRISDNVPDWFVSMMSIDPPVMEREVSHQWRKVGKVEVQSRAGYAYEQLWKGAEQTLLWFVSLSLVAVFSLSYLIRLILRPLKGVEKQASALSERQYIEQTELPKTQELRSVVDAMNRMVKRVQRMFEEQTRHIEELRRTAYQDNLTGLANSKATEAQLSDWLDYRKEFGSGTCIYLHIPNLQHINEQLGEDRANNFLKQVGRILAELSMQYQPNIVGRLSGADFMALIPSGNEEDTKRQISTLYDAIKTQSDFYTELSKEGPVVNIAVTQSHEDMSASQLLSEAKVAIRNAIQQNCDIYYPQAFSGSRLTSSTWQEHVASAINNQQVFLQYQPVISAQDSTIVQRELLARILNQDNAPCSALEFIPVVKELGLIEALDKAVLEQAMAYLASTNEGAALTINLSQQAIHSDNFTKWIKKAVKQNALRGRLNIEINETAVLTDVDLVAQFRSTLKQAGIGFGVDNFGIHPSGFSYLYAIQPDYIKIDGSLCKHVEDNPEDRFFVSSLITAAHSLGIKAYAERVERDTQVASLAYMNIDGTQGFLHGIPEALK